MIEIREICIVSSAKDYAEMEFFKEFFKWIGFSFFAFIYQENTENTKLNALRGDTSSRFDMILYIGDDSKDWEKRYSQCGKLHVHVASENIWEEIQGKGKNSNKITWKVKASLLRNVWTCIYKSMPSGSSSLKKIVNDLIRIYRKYDLLRALTDNRYSLYMRNMKAKNDSGAGMELSVMELDKFRRWEKAAAEMEAVWTKHRDAPDADGKACLLYALCYCRRKVNEYCDLCRMEKKYRTGLLLHQIDGIYEYDERFYAAENLKAKVSLLDDEKKSFTISYFRNCTLACEVDLSNSYHYYRLGKRYELAKMEEKAVKAFQISYDKNNLNFRALFKLAADRYRKKKWKEAEADLLGVLRILQLNVGDEQVFFERLKLLPPLELEYASKCCILLGRIEEKQNSRKAGFYYKRVETIKISVDTNTYLKQMFPEEEKYESVRKNVENRLTKKIIEDKLKCLAS